jgi:small subunit ribosomal protein S16
LAVKLRLRRMGKKRQPIYKVVAADARSPRDGKYIEAIGSYNPKTDPATIELNEERALYWLGCGAQPTETVKNLLNKKGILLKKELLKEGLSEEAISAKLEEWGKNKDSLLEKKKVKAEQQKKEKTEAAKKKLEEENKQKEVEAAEVEDTASEDVSAEEEKPETE